MKQRPPNLSQGAFTKKLLPCLLACLLICLSAWTTLSTAHAATEAQASTRAVVEDAPFTRTPEELCPTEKFDAVTVQGKYIGWQIPRSPSGTITVRLRDSHVPLHIITSATRAKSLFGDNYDAAVEVTYDFIQHYSREDKKCHQFYMLKTGKIIKEQKKGKFYH